MQFTNLYIAGYGNVGKVLVRMIAEGGDKIALRTGRIIRICGLSNSRHWVADPEGIDASDAASLLKKGASAAQGAFFRHLESVPEGHNIFVDCTASQEVASRYAGLCAAGFAIVACNKIAFAAPYASYASVKDAAIKGDVQLRYETTVGAALPIIASVARGVNSGDEIQSVEAVLSGTLNYIFSNYRGGTDGVTFAALVKRAMEAGYAEPDPRLDLSGTDVLRKLLILAREAGIPLESTDVESSPAIGQEYFSLSLEEFFASLEKNESSFAAAWKAAEDKGCRLRYVARLEKRHGSWYASTGLAEVPAGSILYNLQGTDNCAVIKSEFYPSPLVIQGAGAGASQTASGVLNDILSL